MSETNKPLSEEALNRVTGGVFSQDQPSGTPDEMELLGNFPPSTDPIGSETPPRKNQSETDEKTSSPEQTKKSEKKKH